MKTENKDTEIRIQSQNLHQCQTHLTHWYFWGAVYTYDCNMWDCHESGTTSEYPATSDHYCLLLQITIHTIHMQISGRVFWSLAPCDGIVSVFVWTIQSCFWEDVHINAWIIEIFAYIFNMPVQWPWIQHTSSSVLTIAWKDSVKTTLGWYLTRLRVLVWLCRKEIATAFVYVWLMKGISH